MKFEILLYGNELLRNKARRVEQIDAAMRQLAGDMLETMYAMEGVGLAAAQVGRGERMCVIDLAAGDPESEKGNTPNPNAPMPPMPLILVNPDILDRLGEEKCKEGCLSFPELSFSVARAAEITISFTDLDNRPQTLRAAGLLARAIQHEVDHLDGILVVDRISQVQKVALAGRLRKLRRQGRK